MRLGEDNGPGDGTGTLVVWRVLDGKAGHESQTSGLVAALGRRVPVEVQDLPAVADWRAWLTWLTGRFWAMRGGSVPDLIVGAGHRSHATLLAARRVTGGRTVVLMRPSLPLRWFDVCLIPAHDNPPKGESIIRTTGVLNPIRRSDRAAPNRGLILVGGPSSSHGWDRAGILKEVANLVANGANIEWTLTTSRRTPDETVRAMEGLSFENLSVIPFEQTYCGWVKAYLEACGIVWVTEDSMSMIFEALTAGATVGVLAVPRRRRDSRVIRAVESLRREGQVLSDPSTLAQEATSQLRTMPPLSEADRCAELILQRFKLIS